MLVYLPHFAQVISSSYETSQGFVGIKSEDYFSFGKHSFALS